MVNTVMMPQPIFYFFFLISELIQWFDKKKQYFNPNHLLIAVFILLNKITMAFAVFLPFIFFKKKNFLSLFQNPKVYFAFTFLFFWIIKNIVVSGCMIYPINKLCFGSLEWSNISQVKAVSEENEAWTKSWPDFKNINNISQKEYSSKFNWISTWNKTHLKKINKILIPYIILLSFILLVIHLKYKNKKLSKYNHFNKDYLLLIIFMIIFTFIWFIKVPVYRYGYSYFISFIALSFAYICTKKYSIKKTAASFFSFFLIFFISVFVLKNIIRITKPENYNKKFFPKIVYLDNSDIKKIELNHLFYYESNKMCGYNFSPCTHYKNQKLKSKKYYSYKAIIVD